MRVFTLLCYLNRNWSVIKKQVVARRCFWEESKKEWAPILHYSSSRMGISNMSHKRHTGRNQILFGPRLPLRPMMDETDRSNRVDRLTLCRHNCGWRKNFRINSPEDSNYISLQILVPVSQEFNSIMNSSRKEYIFFCIIIKILI